MRIYLFIAAVAGGVTYLLTPLIRHIAIEIGAVGEVRARDVHTVPTPRMGGLGMLIGFTVAMVLVSTVRERLEDCDCPKAFRGFPIALLAAGLLALSFMGFSGFKVFG